MDNSNALLRDSSTTFLGNWWRNTFVYHLLQSYRISNIKEFSADIPMITLSFWSGTIGAILSYVYERINGQLDKQEIMYPMSRFFFGGIVGAASFLFIKSTFLLKLLYPKIDISTLSSDQLVSYQPVVATAVLCGMVAPSLIKGIRKKAGTR
jgi:hypothetical protein